jgi:hypothetical protein
MGTTKLVIGTVALAAGVVAGILIGRSGGGNRCSTPEDQVIHVSATSSLSCAEAKISRKLGNRVFWNSPLDTTLEVVFRTPVPFKVHCIGNVCYSDPPDINIPLGSYDYAANVTPSQPGGSEPAPDAAMAASPARTRTPATQNGRIIIEK